MLFAILLTVYSFQLGIHMLLSTCTCIANRTECRFREAQCSLKDTTRTCHSHSPFSTIREVTDVNRVDTDEREVEMTIEAVDGLEPVDRVRILTQDLPDEGRSAPHVGQQNYLDVVKLCI